MVLRRLLPVCLAAGALAASACGGAASSDSADDFAGEAKLVAVAIDDLANAGRQRDADEICARYLSVSLVDQIKGNRNKTCESTLGESLKDVDAFDIEVVKDGIKVSGTTATARVKSASGDDDRLDTLQLVKEPQRSGGKTVQVWKLSAFGS